jgi:hypothetical protein
MSRQLAILFRVRQAHRRAPAGPAARWFEYRHRYAPRPAPANALAVPAPVYGACPAHADPRGGAHLALDACSINKMLKPAWLRPVAADNPQAPGAIALRWDLSFPSDLLERKYWLWRGNQLLSVERMVYFIQALMLLCLCFQASLHLVPTNVNGLLRCGIWGWVLLAASMRRHDAYLRHRALIINAVRLVVALLSWLALGSLSRARQGSFSFQDARLTFVMRALGLTSALLRPLEVFGMQLGFRQQLLHVALGTATALCSRTTLDLLAGGGPGEPGLAAAAQQLHQGMHATAALATWALDPATVVPPPPPRLERCGACDGLVVLLALHLASSLLLLYIFYMSDWRHRRRFLRSQHPSSAADVQAACDTVAAQVMLDCRSGVVRAALAHLAVLAMLLGAAYVAAHTLALEVLPQLLPGELYARLCPAAPLAR